MFAFQDFPPHLIKSGGVFSPAEYEFFWEVVARANQWVLENEKQVMNVETLILPLHTKEGDEPWTKSVANHPAMYGVPVVQMLRVWYRS